MNKILPLPQLGVDGRQDLAATAAIIAPSSPPFRSSTTASGGDSGGGRDLQPRPFLKRGSGLSRFNLPPDPALQPSRLHRRSRSSPKLGGDHHELRNPARLRYRNISCCLATFSLRAPPPRPVITLSLLITSCQSIVSRNIPV